MNIGLLIIGDEILSGKRQDKHLPKVIALLQTRGLALSWARYAGDEPERITADLRHAFASGDLVFSCGGIGATPDDHTRQCAGAALGRALELHPEARALIEQRMHETAIAQGKVYAPDEAKALGLIDAIGYQDDAIDAAASLAGLPEPKVVRYRKRKGLMEALSSPRSADGLRLGAELLREAQTPRILLMWKVE